MENLQNTSINTSQYRDLPVVQLVESPTNPRKRYNDAGLQELAESIRAQGVLVPLLVRESAPECFEIIAGSRRFRAAALAGIETVPVRVVPFTDAEAVLTQVVENLQRENVHPLEEAHGFRALLDLPDQPFTIATVASKAGKSPQYVAGRLRLTELVPEAAEAFLADRISLGHALQIAKLLAAQQHGALAACFKTTWLGSGQTEVLVPIRELSSWIEANVLLDLQIAPFDRADAGLVPEAGSCHDCAKRTGSNTLLFPEAATDQCLERECYHAKLNAHIARALQNEPQLIQISTAWGSQSNGVLTRGQYVEIIAKSTRNGRAKPEQKKCLHISKALVVEGSGCGQFVSVCADPNCQTHFSEARKADETRERVRAEQRKQEERRKENLAICNRLLSAILEKATAPLGKSDIAMVADEFIRRLPQEDRIRLSQRHTPETAKGKKLPAPVEPKTLTKDLDETGYSRLLIELALLESATNPYSRDGMARLKSIAKRYRINADKIAESVAAEFETRRKQRLEKRGPKAKRSRKQQPAGRGASL